MSNYGFVRVATATPRLRVADVAYNVAEMVSVCKKVAAENVQFLVLPELAITGYTCADLFFQRELQQAARKGLRDLIDATRDCEMLFVVGLALATDNQLFNCAAVCCSG